MVTHELVTKFCKLTYETLRIMGREGLPRDELKERGLLPSASFLVQKGLAEKVQERKVIEDIFSESEFFKVPESEKVPVEIYRPTPDGLEYVRQYK